MNREIEVGVIDAVAIQAWRETQIACVYVGNADHLTGRNGHTIQAQVTVDGQRIDAHGRERLANVGIDECEVCIGERNACIF